MPPVAVRALDFLLLDKFSFRSVISVVSGLLAQTRPSLVAVFS